MRTQYFFHLFGLIGGLPTFFDRLTQATVKIPSAKNHDTHPPWLHAHVPPPMHPPCGCLSPRRAMGGHRRRQPRPPPPPPPPALRPGERWPGIWPPGGRGDGRGSSPYIAPARERGERGGGRKLMIPQVVLSREEVCISHIVL